MKLNAPSTTAEFAALGYDREAVFHVYDEEGPDALDDAYSPYHRLAAKRLGWDFNTLADDDTLYTERELLIRKLALRLAQSDAEHYRLCPEANARYRAYLGV